MITKTSFHAAALACGLVALSLTACSSADPQANEASACDAYSTFISEVGDARSNLSASSTIEDITGARDDIKTAYEDLESALDKVDVDRTDALEDAWDTFDDAVDDVDTELTIPAAVASLQEEAAAIVDAQQGLDSALACQ